MAVAKKEERERKERSELPQPGEEDDVVAFLQSLMRDEEEDSRMRLKAAELLAKQRKKTTGDTEGEEKAQGLYVWVEYGNDFFPHPKKRTRKTTVESKKSAENDKQKKTKGER